MTELDERLAALSPEKRALYEKLLQRKLEEAPDTTFPISMMQEGIWFLEQLKPGNPGYILPAAIQIRGQLDRQVLRRVINEIVRRHESLRTTFELRDGKPVQVVHREMIIDLPEGELRDAATGGTGLRAALTTMLSDPFDLATGPLLRVRLLRTGPGEHVLAVAMHHLVSDGWSVGILVSELAALYEAFMAGRPSPLPDLKVQYGDYSVWQRGGASAGGQDADLQYWRSHLAGAPAVLALPTDRPRPAVQGFNGASVPFGLPAAVMSDLTALAKQNGATTYMALLAVFQILLHRYSRQDDVVTGVPMANRGRAEIEPLIGFFVNTLPVRTDLSGEPGFLDVLKRVREACLGAYAHQGIAFEKVVADVRPARDLSKPPIFQVSLSYQADPLPARDLAGLELRWLSLRSAGSRFDLEVQLLDEGGAVSGWIEYDRDLFDEQTVITMAAAFRRLAEAVIAQPGRPAGRLDLLGGERPRILADRNSTARDWPGAGWIHECFEEQARRSPDAEALRYEGRSLSYAELNRRANQLAHRLRRLGAGPDVLVGVSLDRSPALVISLLAVLKAGAAYVPLDPGYPRARLRHMLADAAVPVLLTQRRVLAGLPPSQATVLCADELPESLAGEPGGNPGVPVDGENLAYVIYTSGSTGKPKGAMNVHAAIRSRLLWMQDAYQLDATDRVLQKTPFSFDVSVWEFFWPLMTGATLVLARPGGHQDSGYLAGLIAAEKITTVHFVPSMLQAFLREPDVSACTTLRRVICSGEALPRDLQERFFARSGAELHNLYGPTEAAVDVTAWACRRGHDPRPVPIGYPVANTQMYVLDRHLEPVPDGVPGELYIGGRNLARGYLGRPGLTAGRFVPDPYGGHPGARLYQTGDLARRRGDGAIDYLGRLDHQVKLRGFRVELGEIEAALAEHPQVREAIVVTREHAPGDVRLVAYLTGDEPPGPAELAGYLKERLPEYMVPAVFVMLPAFPVTPNGKADRAALPEPDLGRPELANAFVAPRGDLERSVAALWRELLGVGQVGVHDNFFDLGGHSLLMSELKARLATSMHREVSMVELFQNPTVSSLAGYLSSPAEAAAEPLLGAHDRADGRRQTQHQRQQAAARRASSRTGR
jgi:amino acid adenylation domain-containing protein